MNTREGISVKDDRLPERFTSESRKSDPENIRINTKEASGSITFTGVRQQRDTKAEVHY
ncbi:MAG: hypothetical protein R2727_11625 [Bacteroidales bacterium]